MEPSYDAYMRTFRQVHGSVESILVASQRATTQQAKDQLCAGAIWMLAVEIMERCGTDSEHAARAEKDLLKASRALFDASSVSTDLLRALDECLQE